MRFSRGSTVRHIRERPRGAAGSGGNWRARRRGMAAQPAKSAVRMSSAVKSRSMCAGSGFLLYGGLTASRIGRQ